MSIDDLYNNFKIVKQDVKKFVGASSGAQNLAFITSPRTSSTNDVNTASPAYEVSTVSSNINIACPQVSTANFSDNTVYAFMVKNPNGSNLLQQDLEQIHKDDLEAMDLKWQLSLLSMRAKRYFQRTGKKIFINANDTVGYDKSKVECFNCHKMGHFARECRTPSNKEGQFRNQDNTRKQGNNEDTSSKAMLAINGVGFEWSDMAEEQVQTNMALMAFQTLSEFEKVKQEKEGIEFKIEKFDKASKDLDKLLESQITDKSKKGLGYSVVLPPHLLIYNRPKKLDLSYYGLDEFKEPEFKGYGTENSKKESNIVCDKKSYDSKENSNNSLVKEHVSKDTSSFVESSLNVDKETIFPVDKKVESVKPKNHEKPVKKSVRTVNTSHPKSTVFSAKPMSCFPKTAQSTVRRPFQSKTALSNKRFTHKVNTAKAQAVNIARPQAVNTVRPKTVKTARLNSAVVNVVRVNQAIACKPQQDDTGFVNSGCSRHMTGNIAYLSDFKEFDGGYVTFEEGAHGGRISSKGTLKTDSLDFEDLPDESQILLKIPRKDNMYSFDMKNIVPKETFTCLVTKATSDESMLWHRRLGHINFKNINKLVTDNLVRGLPTKCFENDQTCVACLKGKQHRASCKSKVYIGFLTTKDETSEILKNFIKEIENLVDKKVKIIRSDNGTEFKNKVMDDFYREKCIKREYSVARTPQQNGVAERRNRTLE
ncbi:ribonuclease H-like domain-containing protein [Tanacetum coccineum]